MFRFIIHIVSVMIIALFCMVCSEIPFGGISYGIETSQLSCVANQLAGFCGVRVFHEGCFQIGYTYFWTKIFPLFIFCVLTANFSGLMCQDVLLLIGLQIIFVLIVIQLCHHLYRGASWSFFSLFIHADR